MADVMKNLGENLHRLRLEKGMDRQNLSARLGIPEKDLENIENGTKDIDTSLIYKIAEILHIDINDLLASTTTKNKLLQQIKSKLDTCSEPDLISIYEYIDVLLNKKY